MTGDSAAGQLGGASPKVWGAGGFVTALRSSLVVGHFWHNVCFGVRRASLLRLQWGLLPAVWDQSTEALHDNGGIWI